MILDLLALETAAKAEPDECDLYEQHWDPDYGTYNYTPATEAQRLNAAEHILTAYFEAVESVWRGR